MLRSVATLALCLAALSGAGHASAFGLADPEGRTVVGQPLDLRFAVVATAGEALQARCAQVQVRLGERLLPAHQVRVRVAGEGEGAQRLRVTTTVPVTTTCPSA